MSDQLNKKFKVVLIGAEKVGKSQMCQKLCKKQFQQAYKQTVGCEFYQKTFQLNDNDQVNLQIWDFGSQIFDTDSNMLDTYMYNTDFILYVYDISNKDSFDKIIEYQKKLQKYQILTKNTAIVGNKYDLYHINEVKNNEQQQECDKKGMKSFWISAKTGQKLNEMFLTVSSILLGFQIKEQIPLKSLMEIQANENIPDKTEFQLEQNEPVSDNTKKKQNSQIQIIQQPLTINNNSIMKNNPKKKKCNIF